MVSTNTRKRGEWGEKIAAKVFKDVKLVDKNTDKGRKQDRRGIDGHIGELPVQVKYDRKIKSTKNIYDEFYEKSYANEKWRYQVKPHNCYYKIFVTDDKYDGKEHPTYGFAVLMTVDEMTKLQLELSKKGELKLEKISETSVGILIPLDKCEKVATRWVEFEYDLEENPINLREHNVEREIDKR